MTLNLYRTILLILGIILIGLTAYLVMLNTRAPGFCPTYPILGIPACQVVLAYFCVMVLALFVSASALAKLLFYGAAGLAFLSSLWFSAFELANHGHQCPQLFSIPIPLCFTVAPTMAVMAFIAHAGSRDQF